MYRTCSCGEEQTETVPAKGHTEGDWITDKQATCAEEGSKHKECTVCHEIVATESISTSSNHVYGEGTLNISADGRTATTDLRCTACGNDETKPYTGNLVKENVAYSFENGARVDINGEFTVNGDTYYAIDNAIQINVYALIGDLMCYYGDNGVKSNDVLSNREVTDVNGNTYYVVDNAIQINVYALIGDLMCYYGDNGVKSSDVLSNVKVTDITGKTYYVVNNVIKIDIFVVISDHVYYFDGNGCMVKNDTHKGYSFGEDGAMTDADTTIEIEETLYEVKNGTATPHTTCVDNDSDHKCDVCDKTTSKCVPDDENAVWIKQIDATCSAVGTLGHYHCSVCGKDFDESKNELTSLEIPATGIHNYVNGACEYCGKEKVSEGLVYSINSDGKTCTITGIGTCTETNIVIPNTIDGYTVTSIGDRAFNNCKSLTSTTIPNSVTSIESYAFSSCSNLTNITIPDSVTNIGDSAFNDCDALQYNEYQNAYYIGNTDRPYLVLIKAKGTTIASCIINDSTKFIQQYAFKGCSSLTNITIPDCVKSIGYSAFSDCTRLTSVTIGKNVTSIGNDAFGFCTSLTSITIPDSVTSIGRNAFHCCTSLTSITIPDSVKSIGEFAFHGTGLTSVTIGDSVTSIGYSTFGDCARLTSVRIGKNVTSIGDCAFQNCTLLTSIIIPDSIISIGEDAFDGCESLTSVYYNGTIDQWVQISFSNAYSNPFCYAENLYIDNKLVTKANITTATTINAYALYSCTSLTSVTIGESVTSIGDYAFYNCTSLTTINFTGTKEQWNAITKGEKWDYYYTGSGYAQLSYTIVYNYKED